MGADASDLSRWEPHDRLAEMALRLAREVPDSRASRDTARLLELVSSESLREVWEAVEDEDRNDGYPGQISDAVATYEESA